MISQIFSQASLLLFVGASLSAQQPVLLPQGTEINFSLQESLSLEQTSSGQTIPLLVQEDVIIEDQIVVAAGATGSGLIVSIHKAEEDDEKTSIAFQFVSCFTVDGQLVFLDGEEQWIGVNETPNENEAVFVAQVRTDLAVQISSNSTATDSDEALSPQYPPPSAENPDYRIMILPAGLEIPMQLSDECIPSSIAVGTSLRLRVMQDVIEGGKLIFPAKSPGIGRVKFVTENQIYVEAVAVTAIDGQTVAVVSDNSIAIEFDPEKGDELLLLDKGVPALLSAVSRIMIGQ